MSNDYKDYFVLKKYTVYWKEITQNICEYDNNAWIKHTQKKPSGKPIIINNDFNILLRNLINSNIKLSVAKKET